MFRCADLVERRGRLRGEWFFRRSGDERVFVDAGRVINVVAPRLERQR